MHNSPALIDGKWVAGSARFDVIDPATGRKLADVANLGADETVLAIAAAERARVVSGGQAIDARFYRPTVLADVTPEMMCCQEETFGPDEYLETKYLCLGDIQAQATCTE